MDGDTFNSGIVRDFIAAWRRGESATATELKSTAEYYHGINPAVFTALQTMSDVELSVPFGSSNDETTKEIHA